MMSVPYLPSKLTGVPPTLLKTHHADYFLEEESQRGAPALKETGV